MRYIDKTLNLEEGNSYSSDFLCESFNEDDKCFYPTISSKQAYENFSNKKYRYGDKSHRGFEPLLVEEQKNYCCYCMGKIESHNVTLEHIIPESFDVNQNPNNEFAYYTGYAPILSLNVELASTFTKKQFFTKEDIKKIEKYPHLISYVNIAASCHGIIDKKDGTSCFCNNPRGNKRIIPLMLMENSPSIVTYNQLGIININLKKEEAESTIKALQLNNDTLQEIRMLWYKISRTSRTVMDVISISSLKDKIILFKEIFNTNDYTTLEDKWKSYVPVPQLNNIDQSETVYWNLFIKYEWFYEYYKQSYP